MTAVLTVAEAPVTLTYRSLLTMRTDPPEAFRHVDEQLRSWLKSKGYEWDRGIEGPTAFTDTASAAGFDRTERDGSRTSRFELVERTGSGAWTVRVTAHSHPGRLPWVLTDVISPEPAAEQRASPADPPRFVRMLLQATDGFDGSTPMTSDPATVRVDGVDELVRTITDPGRRGLVFVAGTPSGFPIDRWRDYVRKRVRDTVGLGSTFILDAAATSAARERLGAYGPRPGALRTYLPGVELDAQSDTVRHRILTTRTLVDRPEGYVRRVLAGSARQHVVELPLPTDVARVIRLVARWEAGANTPTIRADDVAVQSASPVELPAKNAEADLPAAPLTELIDPHLYPLGDQAEAYLAFVAGIRSVLDQDVEVDLAAVRQVIDRAGRAQTQEEANLQLRRQVEQLREQVEDQEEQIAMSRADVEDAQLDAAVEAERSQDADDLIRYLRNELARAGATAAWSSVPDEQRTAAPESMSELLERMTEFRHVVFTGDEQPVLDLDVTDTLGRCARKAWQAMLALEDYCQIRADGSFTGSVHTYCKQTPGGCHGWSAERHSPDESEQTKNNDKYARPRRLPVPLAVDPSGVVFMGAHFKLVTQRTITPRLHYFDDTGRTGKVYVGYMGRHLPNSQTN